MVMPLMRQDKQLNESNGLEAVDTADNNFSAESSAYFVCARRQPGKQQCIAAVHLNDPDRLRYITQDDKEHPALACKLIEGLTEASPAFNNAARRRTRGTSSSSMRKK